MGQKNYWDEFQQTSKAILFEKFADTNQNGEQLPNLRRYLTEGNVATDSFYKRIEKNLAVRSFDEFMDKFCPWVYETVLPGENGGVEIQYSLEKPKRYDETGMEPTALNATAIYEMVNRLYGQRKNSGKAQIEFDFSEVSRLLSPESQTEKIKQARSDMDAYMQEYYRLEAETPGVPSPEKKNCIDKVNEGRLMAQDVYLKGSSAMLSLKLGDAAAALLEVKNKKGSHHPEAGSDVIGIPFYDTDGELRFKALEQREGEEQVLLEHTSSQKMLELLKQDYEECAPDSMQESPEITNLVLSNISTELVRTGHEESFWLARLESGQQDYKKWMENLADTIAPLVEKFIGVKAFFENATVDGELDSYLIVANATVEELAQVKDRLSEFLKAVNRIRKEKIWFGIIPAVALGNESGRNKDASQEIDFSNPFGNIGNINNQKPQTVKGLASAENVQILLDVCAQAEVMAFYNYKANKNTCFGAMNKKVYEQMRDKLDFSGIMHNGAYAVCCLPNFTIIPEEETTVVINQELVDKGCQKQLVSLQIPSIYIESSYIAAGMTVGAQQKEMLKKKGFEVDPLTPNVRMDFEGKNVYKKFQSNMCLENILPCPRDMEEDIMESRFGFYFSNTEITGEHGRPIRHCFVKNARTMQKGVERYTKISNQLFQDFILMCVLDNQDTVDPDKINEFIKLDARDWSDEAQERALGQEPVNALLRDGEKIKMTNDNTIEIDYLNEKGYVRPEVVVK